MYIDFRASAGILLFLWIGMISSPGVYGQEWKDIKSVEEVCNHYPDQMQQLLQALDLDYPGLQKVKNAFEDDNIVRACKELLNYYQLSPSGSHYHFELPSATSRRLPDADTLLAYIFEIQNVRGQVPLLDNGHRDWHYKGPNNDREWAWLSNRHFQVSQVMDAYFETGNPIYARFVDEFLRDFILASLPYPEKKGSDSVWRGLEVAARAKNWTRIFYRFQKNPLLTPATRLLILRSLLDHAHYSRNFHSQNNWLTMEISALATIAADFPEFKSSPQWLEYTVATMVESMKGQVYPDGTQTELTSHYHTVAMRNFLLFKQICDRVGYLLPGYYEETIRKMYGYIAHTVRPDGYRLLNNDGDRGSDVPLILEGAEIYQRPDWAYIATNGEQGVKPKEGPSYFYPWAGHLISRSGFDKDAHWSFFDMGPWGSGHQHNDKLHLSVAAYGRDLLVDAGRFAYTGAVAEKFRPYARSSRSHNVIMIDEKGQNEGPRLAEEAMSESQCRIEENFDWAWSSMGDYIDVQGEIEHRRGVYYQRGEFWVVVDQILTDRPRSIQALWHWHPDCRIVVQDGRTYTANSRGNLQIVPHVGSAWDVHTIVGQEEPGIQGWYSEEYNKYTPNTAVIYTTRIEENTTFVWLLQPSEGFVQDASVEILSSEKGQIKVKVISRIGGDNILSIPIGNR